MASPNIKTKTARQQLAYKKNPYWHQVSIGLAVGYSVSALGGEGGWHFRASVSPGRYRSQKIPDSHFISTGLKDTKFDQACEFARSHADTLIAGDAFLSSDDVAAIAAAYLADKERQHAMTPGRTRRLKSFISRHISKQPIGKVHRNELSRLDVDGWLSSLVGIDLRVGSEEHRRACSTANRYLAQLKAILNWGKRDGLIATDSAWAHVRKYALVDAARAFIPDEGDFAAVYAAATEPLKSVMTLLAETGMRPGEPLQLKCAHFDASSRLLTVPQETKTGTRSITVTPSAAQILVRCAAGKRPDQFIFGDGSKPLDSCYMSKLMVAARAAAGRSDEFVLYSIRHAWITNAIKGQSSPLQVAKYAGTSMQMIERFYLKFRSDSFIDALSPMFAGAY